MTLVTSCDRGNQRTRHITSQRVLWFQVLLRGVHSCVLCEFKYIYIYTYNHNINIYMYIFIYTYMIVYTCFYCILCVCQTGKGGHSVPFMSGIVALEVPSLSRTAFKDGFDQFKANWPKLCKVPTHLGLILPFLGATSLTPFQPF